MRRRPGRGARWAPWGRRCLPAFALAAAAKSSGAFGQRRCRGGVAANGRSEAAGGGRALRSGAGWGPPLEQAARASAPHGPGAALPPYRPRAAVVFPFGGAGVAGRCLGAPSVAGRASECGLILRAAAAGFPAEGLRRPKRCCLRSGALPGEGEAAAERWLGNVKEKSLIRVRKDEVELKIWIDFCDLEEVCLGWDSCSVFGGFAFKVEHSKNICSGPPTDAPAVDTAEQVYISSLALLKMLKHGRAGVPMEVMGLMLGEFVDDYTVRVIDVFAMPQSGTGVSVEAVDPVFQAKMLDMLKQTGRPEMVVGWYHSHPGFGCWLSGVDINTQQSFEALSERAVAVVVDPIQSVKGKVVIDAFRLINANMMVLGHEPRQTTSNLGHLNKPSIQALIHGLNRHYYSITINYRKNELEQKMLLNLHKKSWMEGLTLQDYSEHCKLNETVVKEMLELAKNYNKAVEEEDKMTPEQLAIKNVGKQDPKRHLEEHVDVLMTSNIVQCLAAMLDTVVFK
ncbi:26S proteasome non-ATPase regulatory subunit 14 [Pelecanus crispus]|uniref:26S proteasome non-ATPase regulatory subunit 14 n=1 Tax=Pelecanus crispus TaxID=36300 RepID=UPI003F5D0484